MNMACPQAKAAGTATRNHARAALAARAFTTGWIGITGLMVEAGGPAMQAGVRYQNTIAALYMGDLLRRDRTPARDKVVELRLEAPTHVDDIVVRFGDGRRDWIQAKLNLASSGNAWERLWICMKAQLNDAAFGPDDRLRLVVGEAGETASNLRAMADRTRSADEAEWRTVRITQTQRKLASSIERVLAGSSHAIFRHLEVDIIEQDRIVRDFAPSRLPGASSSRPRLLVHLRDLAGGRARTRGVFTSSQLREALLNDHDVTLESPADWGLAAYLEAASKLTHITVPGTSAGGEVEDRYHWPAVQPMEAGRPDIEDELPGYWFDRTTCSVDLRLFPTADLRRLIVYAGPGFGKSTLLQALTRRLVRTPLTPVTVALGALAGTGKDLIDYLQDTVNSGFSVNVDWLTLAEEGTVAIFLDGLDEVAPSARPPLVDKIKRFAARFPHASWLLTVRDPSVIPAGFDAPKYELLPLTSSEIRQFIGAWRLDLSVAAADDLAEALSSYPDLARLVRIPLFLAILLATWDGVSALPANRKDLIETYLRTLFRPDEHKPTERVADPERLRDAAEHLAFEMLEKGRIGGSERTVRKLLDGHADAALPAGGLFDDALTSGLLRRDGGARVVFPFPIVQEYLAACWLLAHRADEIPSRAEKAVDRPWAQVVQFALEGLEDGTAVARRLLDRPDDAFATTTRLLARCILNGMACDPDVSDQVGGRLVATWGLPSFWTARRIGQLLRDGWTRPLLPALKDALAEARHFHSGGDDMLALLEDEDLAIQALRRLVEGDQWRAHLSGFQPYITRISDRALEVYSAIARQPGLSAEQAWAIGVLLGRLDLGVAGADRVRTLSLDSAVAPNVRLAAFSLLDERPPAAFWSLVDSALKSDDYHDRWAALDAIKCAPDAEERLMTLLSNADLPACRTEIPERLQNILEEVRLAAFVRAAQADPRLPEEIVLQLRVWAASTGDEAAFHSLVAELDGLPAETVSLTLELLNHYPSRAVGRQVAEALRDRRFLPAERVTVSRALLSGSTHRYKRHGLRSATLETSPPHPELDLFKGQIAAWRAHQDYNREQSLRMECIACEADLPDAVPQLKALLTDIAENHEVGGHEAPLNWPVRNALDQLDRRGEPLPLATLDRLIRSSSSNARIGALYQVGAVATREALEYLVDFDCEEEGDWGLVFSAAERIATRLGITVLRTPSGLEIAG